MARESTQFFEFGHTNHRQQRKLAVRGIFDFFHSGDKTIVPLDTAGGGGHDQRTRPRPHPCGRNLFGVFSPHDRDKNMKARFWLITKIRSLNLYLRMHTSFLLSLSF